MSWQERITSDPEVLLGKPVIRGSRISVELILELLEQGWSHAQILESYPFLVRKDISAVYSFLRECVQHEFFFSYKKAG